MCRSSHCERLLQVAQREPQLLTHLTDQGLLAGLARFQLAAGQVESIPSVGPYGEQPPVPHLHPTPRRISFTRRSSRISGGELARSSHGWILSRNRASGNQVRFSCELARALVYPLGEAGDGVLTDSSADRPGGRGEEAQGAAEAAE